MIAPRARRVLLGWEMGGGLGHIRRLIGIARALRAAGWETCFALRDTVSLEDEVRQVAEHVLPAPTHASQLRPGEKFKPVTFADFMAVCGYRTPSALASTVAGWDRLFDDLAPDLVVADYAPLLHLAAFGRLPLAVVGSGFTVPPGNGEEFPRLRTGGIRLAPTAQLLDNAQSVQRSRGLEYPRTLPELMAGHMQFVGVPPQLDVYHAHRATPADGPLEPLPRPLPPVRSDRQRSVFFYLAADFPGTLPLIRDLMRTGLQIEGYLRQCSRKHAIVLGKQGVRLHDSPPPLPEVLSRNATIVHHGGIGTSLQVLALARPQLILHRHMEQHFNALLLSRLGIAKSLNGESDSGRLPALIRRFCTDQANATRAARTAAQIDRRGSMDRFVTRCDEIAG